MKTYLLLSLTALMLSVSGCRVNIGEGGETIDPSENIVKAKYPQEAFDKVDNHVANSTSNLPRKASISIRKT